MGWWLSEGIVPSLQTVGKTIQTSPRSTPWLQLFLLWSSEPPPGKSGE